MELSNRFSTICVVGYTGSVAKHQEPRAAGGVCLCQARKTKDGKIFGKYVNSNGRYLEEGEAFLIEKTKLNHWISIAKASK
jgi:hypothetical protein